MAHFTSTSTLPLYTSPTLHPAPSASSLAHQTLAHQILNPNPASSRRRLALSFLSSSLPIPPDLSLEHVLSDSLCVPLSLRDFFAFLRDTDRAQENLAFVLWFREYERRFWALPERERARAEKVEPGEEWARYLRRREEERERERLEKLMCDADGEDQAECSQWEDGRAPWDSISLDRLDTCSPFADPLGVIREEHDGDSDSDSGSNDAHTVKAHPTASTAAIDAETLAIAPWMEAEVDEEEKKRMRGIISAADDELERTVQLLMRDDLPFRDEIVRIVLHFLTPSSPHALSSPHIPALLLTLRRTTHPHSFHALYTDLYTHLALDTHPRFIRSALANTRAPLRAVVYALAIGLYLCGGIVLGVACIAVPGVNRAWRVCSVPLVWAGLAVSLGLLSGVCPMVYGTKRRQLSVWEAMEEPPAAPDSKPSLNNHGQTTTTTTTKKKRCPPSVGIFEFVYNDWWAGHPAARKMQNEVLKGAALWAAVGALLWAMVILSVPGRSSGE